MNIVIMGAGVVGSHVAEILSHRGYDITIVDSNSSKLQALSDRLDIRSYLGEATDHKTLISCGVNSADLVLGMTNFDTVNLVSTSMAKLLGAKKVIARVKEKIFLEDWDKQYQNWFHIDQLVSPELLTAKELAKRIGTAGFYVPDALSESNIALQEWLCPPDTPFINRALKDVSEFTKVMIPSIFRQNEILIPSGMDQLLPLDRFFMVGPVDSIKEISKKLQSASNKNRSVTIYGGNMIGLTLAKLLEKTRLSVRIIDSDINICKMLSQNLSSTLVVHGNCLDESFLLEQGIQYTDVFIAITYHEEDNLVASLIAKNLGAKSTIVLSDRMEYVEIMKRLGIDTTVSPRLIVANSLLKDLDPGPVKTIIILQENKAEVVEVLVKENARLLHMTIAKMGLPKGMIISALIRDHKVIVPRGDIAIEPHDRLLIFTLIENIDFILKNF